MIEAAEEIVMSITRHYLRICNSFSLTQSQDRYIAANICPIEKISLKRNVSAHTIDKAEGESILLLIQQVLQAEPYQ